MLLFLCSFCGLRNVYFYFYSSLIQHSDKDISHCAESMSFMAMCREFIESYGRFDLPRRITNYMLVSVR